MIKRHGALALFLIVFAPAGMGQITLPNNTAACSASGGHCSGAFPGSIWPFAPFGWYDNNENNGNNVPPGPPSVGGGVPGLILTPRYNPAPMNIANNTSDYLVDLHTLAPSPATKIIAEMQAWFCDSSDPASDPVRCTQNTTGTIDGQVFTKWGSHLFVGYTSWNTAAVSQQLADMKRRGVDVVALDWSGGPNQCLQTPGIQASYNPGLFVFPCVEDPIRVNLSAQAIRDNSLLNGLTFFLIHDLNAYSKACTDIRGTRDPNAPDCIRSKIIADLTYLATEYAGNTSYERYVPFSDPTKAGIIIGFFQDEVDFLTAAQCATNPSGACFVNGTQCAGQSCWDGIWTGVRSALVTNNTFSGSNFYLIFKGQAGCPLNSGGQTPHAVSDGCYAWPKPYIPNQTTYADVTADTQQYATISGLDTFAKAQIN